MIFNQQRYYRRKQFSRRFADVRAVKKKRLMRPAIAVPSASFGSGRRALLQTVRRPQLQQRIAMLTVTGGSRQENLIQIGQVETLRAFDLRRTI
jgi:hypothetical protein